jgi:hypothetical protein
MGQIDLRSLNFAHRVLLGGGAILFIVMFFTWQGVSLLGTTVGVSGWHGVNGVLLGLATAVLLAGEVLLLVGDQASELRSNLLSKVNVPERLISAALAGAVLVLGILKFLTASQLRRWPEWVGLVVALGIGYGGWLVYSAHGDAPAEAQATSL